MLNPLLLELIQLLQHVLTQPWLPAGLHAAVDGPAAGQGHCPRPAAAVG
jgi:hypothetical protein